MVFLFDTLSDRSQRSRAKSAPACVSAIRLSVKSQLQWFSVLPEAAGPGSAEKMIPVRHLGSWLCDPGNRDFTPLELANGS